MQLVICPIKSRPNQANEICRVQHKVTSLEVSWPTEIYSFTKLIFFPTKRNSFVIKLMLKILCEQVMLTIGVCLEMKAHISQLGSHFITRLV